MQVAAAAGAAGALGGSAVETTAAVPTEQSDITMEETVADIDYDAEHPRVFYDPESVKLAKKNAENTGWGAKLADAITTLANNRPYGQTSIGMDEEDIRQFMDLSDQELIDLAPVSAPDGTYYFAHGYESDILPKNGNASPVDGSPLSIVGFDEPGTTKDESGNVFPGTVDGVDLNDDGDGVVVDPDEVPDDWAAADLDEPTRFWFVAKYNGYVSRMVMGSVGPIATAYAVTGDAEYARTAALLLDGTSAAFPGSKSEVQVDKGRTGRLHHHKWNVDGFVKNGIHAADLLWDSGELDVESPAIPGMTIKENVAENFAADAAQYAWYWVRRHAGGTMEYNSMMIAASALLGTSVGYTEWVIDGPVSIRSFLANSIFRDGDSFETSPLYSRGVAEQFSTIAAIAYFYRDEPYPNGIDFYSNPRFANLSVWGPERLSVAGRIPRYGDVSQVDTSVETEPMNGDFNTTLTFYGRDDEETTKTAYAQQLAQIAGGNPNEQFTGEIPGPGELNYWDYRTNSQPLFNIDGTIEGFDLGELSGSQESELLPGKGFAMYRPEEGFGRATMMRYGATLFHGHRDELGLHIYGGGRELSYDPGRRPTGQFLSSFLAHTVSHNTAVVNEKTQNTPGHDGGNVELFANRDGYTVADIADEGIYGSEDVDTYRRTTAFVDTSDEHSYLFDVFRVAGAKTVDYPFHGQGVHFDSSLEFSAPADGSLASEEYFWGDKVNDAGEIEGFEDKDDDFIAPPGNAYGFLGHPRSASGDEPWQATWTVDESRGAPASIRLTMLGEDDREVVATDAPDLVVDNLGLDPAEHDLQYVLARDEGPTSQFTSVIEPVGESFPVESVEELETSDVDAAFDPVAAKVTLADGRVDYFLSTVGDEQFTAKLGEGDLLQTDATFGMVRTDGNGSVLTARMEEGTRLQAKFGGGRPLMVEADDDEWTGSIIEVDYDEPSLLVDTDWLPTGDALAGQHAIVDADRYGHNSPYRIASVDAEGGNYRIRLEDAAMDLGQGTTESIEGNVVENPADFKFTYAIPSVPLPGRDTPNEYLDGKRVVNQDTGTETTVADMGEDHNRVELADVSGFEVGDSFKIWDITAGDEFRIPLSAAIRNENGSFSVDAPENVDVVSSGGGTRQG